MSTCTKEALLKFCGGGVRCISKEAKLYWIEKKNHKTRKHMFPKHRNTVKTNVNSELTFLSMPEHLAPPIQKPKKGLKS